MLEQSLSPPARLSLRAYRRQKTTATSRPAPELRGAALAIQECREREVVLSGPARSSKTFGALYKLHTLAQRYPGARFLIIRQTRESLSESALVTFEQDVVGVHDPLVQGASRSNRHAYHYSNGSEIIVGGFRQSGKDQTEKVMSTEYDGVFVNEVSELRAEQWERLTTRLTRFKAGYPQIVGDMNPPPPSHWIWKREREGKTKTLRAELTDNPRWWTGTDWTAAGRQVYDTLASLTGVLRDRLFLGLAAAYEGLVYDNFGMDNLTDEEPDPERPFEIAFDDGFIDPRAILFIQRKPTHLLVFDELYHRKHLEETCVSEVIDLCGKYFGWRDEEARQPNRLPDLAVGSHEAVQLHKRFIKANIPSRHALHRIVEGIKVVRGLICDGNGTRALRVNRRCANLIEEVTSGYQYPPEGSRRNEEEPLDENNHAADALRMWCWLRARA